MMQISCIFIGMFFGLGKFFSTLILLNIFSKFFRGVSLSSFISRVECVCIFFINSISIFKSWTIYFICLLFLDFLLGIYWFLPIFLLVFFLILLRNVYISSLSTTIIFINSFLRYCLCTSCAALFRSSCRTPRLWWCHITYSVIDFI